MSDNGSANEDMAIAFASVVATIAKNCPQESPTALVGAGIISGIMLAEADVKLMGRVVDKVFPGGQLKMTRASAKSIVKMFRELERLEKLTAALPS